jgi:hypothetical protein
MRARLADGALNGFRPKNCAIAKTPGGLPISNLDQPIAVTSKAIASERDEATRVAVNIAKLPHPIRTASNVGVR